MGDNPIKGTHEFSMGDQKYTLRYTWDAIAQINEKYPDGHNLMNPVALSEIAAIGLAEHHPEMTGEAVRKISPPMMVVVEAVTKALNYAYFGTGEPPKREDGSSPRKTARTKTSSSAPSEPLTELESIPDASGA